MEPEKFMEEALLEANKALDAGEVPVGCVLVYNDEVIARAGNFVNATKNATKHAELLCIDQVLEYCRQQELKHSDVFKQISVVVSVEPCIMCSAALHMLDVKEIIYGCANDRFGGKTVMDVPEVVGKSLPISGGIFADEAMRLLKEFYKGENPSAPVAKTKRSLNGEPIHEGCEKSTFISPSHAYVRTMNEWCHVASKPPTYSDKMFSSL